MNDHKHFLIHGNTFIKTVYREEFDSQTVSPNMGATGGDF